MASISASPAEGPSRIATATARFNSTTGDGSNMCQLSRGAFSYLATFLPPSSAPVFQAPSTASMW